MPLILRSNMLSQPAVIVFNAAFTLSGFNDQERNLTFVKTVFQVL